MKLDMGQMQGQPCDPLDSRKRGLHIARHAQVTAMDMERMGHPQFIHGTRQGRQDLARCDPIVDILLVEIELALIEFESIDPAGIDHLDG
jgi:hypothetical protein